jgi:hypothetical protein
MTDRLLTRRSAAHYLGELGYPLAEGTLSKLACIGGGPPFLRFGRQVLYAPDDLVQWVHARTTRHTSTSDPGAARPASPPQLRRSEQG